MSKSLNDVPVRCYTCATVIEPGYRRILHDMSATSSAKTVRTITARQLAKQHLDETELGAHMTRAGFINACCRGRITAWMAESCNV